MFENRALVDLTVGRSRVRQRILALLMDESTGRLHLREIQRRADTSPGTASRELGKLVAAGLVDREAEGNQVYFRASGSPFASMVRSLLVAMPAPEFKPRPPRLLRTMPAAAGLANSSGSVDVAERIRHAGPATNAGLPTGASPVAELASAADMATLSEASEGRAPRVISLSMAVDVGPREIGTDLEPEDLRSSSGGASSSAAGRTASAGPTSTSPDPRGLEIARRFAENLRPLYGQALRGIYLCGDRAAGPTSASADVDVVIVLDRVDQYGAELERTSHVCAAMSRELNLVVSRIFVADVDWNGGPDGTLPLVRTAAVAV